MCRTQFGRFMTGEISPDIVFCKKNKTTCTGHSGWVRMDYGECVRMHLCGGKQKTREKEGEMGVQDVFLNACSQQQKNRKLAKMVVMLFQYDLDQEGWGDGRALRN